MKIANHFGNIPLWCCYIKKEQSGNRRNTGDNTEITNLQTIACLSFTRYLIKEHKNAVEYGRHNILRTKISIYLYITRKVHNCKTQWLKN